VTLQDPGKTPDLSRPLVAAFGYERVSLEEQAEGDAISLEVQRDLITRFAAKHGLTIIRRYRDVESGRKTGREEYQRMLAAIRRGEATVVIAKHIDRFGRNMKEQMRRWLEMDDLDVELLCASEPNANRRDSFGNLYRAISMWKAEDESARTAERVRSSQRHKIEHEPHWYYRDLPYGWRKEAQDGQPRIVIDPAEQAVVREMATRYVAGESLARIAAALNESGSRTRRGRPWHQPTVRFMILRPLNTGMVVWGAKENSQAELPPLRLPDKLPRLLDEGLVARVQERQQRRSKRERPGRSLGSRFLLGGLLRCGLCGGAVVGTGRSYYTCMAYHQHRGCSARRSYPAAALEEAVIAELDALTSPERVAALIPPPEPARDYAAERTAIEEQLRALEARMRKSLAAYQQDLIDAAQLKMAADVERAEREELQPQLGEVLDAEAQAARARASAETLTPRITSWLETCRKVPLAASKAALADLVTRITVTPEPEVAEQDGRKTRQPVAFSVQVDLRL
jgi:site-specific DNA recombinase